MTTEIVEAKHYLEHTEISPRQYALQRMIRRVPRVRGPSFVTSSTQVVVVTNEAFITTTPEITLQTGITTDAWKQTIFTNVTNDCSCSAVNEPELKFSIFLIVNSLSKLRLIAAALKLKPYTNKQLNSDVFS